MADAYDKKGSGYLPAIPGMSPVGGGKFFGGKSTPKMVMEGGEWVYYNTFVVALGQRLGTAPVSIGRIWANDILIADRYEGTRMPGLNFKFFPGDEDQGEVYRGMHYRGLMTLLITDMPLIKFGNSVPNISVELVEGVAGTDDVAGPLPFSGNWGTGLGRTPFHIEIAPDGKLRGVTITQIVKQTKVTQQLCFDAVNMDTKSMDAKVLNSYFSHGVPDINPDQTDTVFAYLPNGLCLIQIDKQKDTRYLLDLGSGLISDFWGGVSGSVTSNSETDFVPWNIALGFQVPTDALIDGFVMGVSSSGDWGILSAKAGALRYAYGAGQEFADPVQCLTRAGMDGDFAQVLVTFADRVDNVKVGRIGSAGGYLATVQLDNLYTHVDAGEIWQTFYSTADNCLVLLVITNAGTRAGYARKINMSGVVQWTSEAFTLPVDYSPRQRTMEATAILDNNMLVIKRGSVTNGVTVILLDTGDIELKTVSAGTFATGNITVWNAANGTFYGPTNTPYRMVALPDGEAADILVEDFLRGLAVLAGYDEADFEANGTEDMTMGGYVISSGASFQQVANGVGQLYGFTWLERTDKIVVSYNYNSDGEFVPDMVIPADDIAVIAENANSGELTAVLAPTSEFPKALSVSYSSLENDFASVPQGFSRSDFPVATQAAEGRLDIRIPITLEDAKASALLYNMAFRLWAARVSYEIRLPVEYVKLDAGDGIEFTAEGYTYQASVVSHRFNTDKSVTLSLTEATGAFYPVEELVELQPSLRGPNKNQSNGVRLVVLDIPDFDAGQGTPDTLALTVIVAGYEADSFGGTRVTLTRVSEPTVATQFLDFAASEGGYVGTLISDISSTADPFALDTETELLLDLGSIPEDRFENIDDADIETTRTNLVAVTINGYTELIAYGQFEPGPEPDTIKLTRLLRGRFGTETFIPWIMPGATVAFLDNAKRGVYPASDYNRVSSTVPETFILSTESAGLISSPTSVTVRPQGYSRKPYAPLNITVTREGVGEDIALTWKKRPRFINYPPSVPADDYPVTEDTTSFAVEIWDETGSEQLRREYTDSEGFVYTVAMQSEDGFVPDDLTQLTVLVYQMASDTVGMGIPGGGIVPITTPGQLSLVIDGGGEIGFELDVVGAPGVLSFTIDGGGEISIEPEFQGYLFLTIDGGGEIDMAVSAGGELRFSINGGGEIEAQLLDTGPLVEQVGFVQGFETVAATSRIITIPTGGHIGDLITITFTNGVTNAGVVPSPASDWVLSCDTNATTNLELRTYTKRLTRADIEAGQFQFNSSNYPCMWCAAIWRNVRAFAATAGWASSSGTSFSMNSIATVGDDSLLVDFVGGYMVNSVTTADPSMTYFGYHDQQANIGSTSGFVSSSLWDSGLTRPNVTYSYGVSASRRCANAMALAPYAVDQYPYGAHRYWRIMPLSNVSGAFELNEVEMHDVFGGTDLCTGGTASATSGTAANAFDNNNATLWTAANNTPFTQTINYDFGVGVTKNIIEIRLGIGTNNVRAPLTGKVQYSDNNTDWTTAWTFSAATWTASSFQTLQNTQATLDNPVDPGGTDQPTIRSHSTASYTSGGGGTLAFPKPAGLAVDDLLAVGLSTTNLYALDTPAGWTRQVDANGAAQCLTKLADAGDVAGSTISLTFSAYSARPVAGVMVAIKDVDPSGPVEAAGVLGNASAGVPPVSPSLTPSATNRLLVAFTMNPAFTDLAEPSGMIPVAEKSVYAPVSTDPLRGAAVAVAYKQLGTTTTATGDKTWTSSAPSAGTHSYSLLLKGA